MIFTRKADPRLRDPNFLKKLEGQYELNGNLINIAFRNGELIVNTAPPQHLEAYKGNSFKVREFSDQLVEFIFNEKGEPSALKLIADGREIILTKRK